MAKFTEDSDKLVPNIQRLLNDAIKHYYPDYNCNIEIERDELNPADYSMIISITNEYGIPVVQLDRIIRDKSGLFKFKH